MHDMLGIHLPILYAVGNVCLLHIWALSFCKNYDDGMVIGVSTGTNQIPLLRQNVLNRIHREDEVAEIILRDVFDIPASLKQLIQQDDTG